MSPRLADTTRKPSREMAAKELADTTKPLDEALVGDVCRALMRQSDREDPGHLHTGPHPT